MPGSLLPEGWGADEVEAALPVYAATVDLLGPEWPRPDRRHEARDFFERCFSFGGEESGPELLTGYYEPEFEGRLCPAGSFRWPLHRAPAGLDPARPWHSRAEIMDGDLLAGQEILWLADPLDAYLAQVQGSVRVRLDDGSMLRLGFGGRNGHPYRSIGAELVARGVARAEAMTLDVVRGWAREHPDALQGLLRCNPSYVFFRVLDLDPSSGPLGAMDRALTPGRSLAADPGHIPPGAPVWVTALGRLMVAQDQGSAIRGRNRGDVFCGSGAAAGALAGRLVRTGYLRILRPKPGGGS